MEGLQKICQSVTSNDNLVLGDGLGLLDIFAGERLILLDGWIHGGLRQHERLVGPELDVKVVGVSVLDGVLGHQVSSILRKGGPGAVSKWKFSASGELVDYGVPNSVQVAGSLLTWEWHEVTSKVTSLVLVVDSGGRVQWLVHITNVVDQEAHGIRETIFLGVILIRVIHNGLVLVGLLVPFCLREPHVECIDNLGDVVRIEGEIVVVDFATLVKEGLINEVPAFLPLAALGLDLISEGGTLDHWVLALGARPFWIRNLKGLKNANDLLVSCWIFLQENLLRNQGGQKVAMIPPSPNYGEQK